MLVTDLVGDLTLERVAAASGEFFPEGEDAHIKYVLWLLKNKHMALVDRMAENYPEVRRKSELIEKLFGIAKQEVLAWLFHEGKDLVDRSIGLITEEAERTMWFREFEFSSVEEMVQNNLDAEKISEGEYYAWLSMQKYVIPMLKAAGVDPDAIWMSSQQTRKVRESIVPTANELQRRIKSGVLTAEAANEQLAEFIEEIAPPNISSSFALQKRHSLFQAEVPENFNGPKQFSPVASAMKKIRLGDKTVYLFVGDPFESTVLEQGVKGRIAIQDSHVNELLKILTEYKNNGRGKE